MNVPPGNRISSLWTADGPFGTKAGGIWATGPRPTASTLDADSFSVVPLAQCSISNRETGHFPSLCIGNRASGAPDWLETRCNATGSSGGLSHLPTIKSPDARRQTTCPSGISSGSLSQARYWIFFKRKGPITAVSVSGKVGGSILPLNHSPAVVCTAWVPSEFNWARRIRVEGSFQTPPRPLIRRMATGETTRHSWPSNPRQVTTWPERLFSDALNLRPI